MEIESCCWEVQYYPRSTPAMWPKLFDLAIENGLNTIETYVKMWVVRSKREGEDKKGKKGRDKG